MTVPPFPFSFTSFYLTALHNPCAGSMTGCWAPVIRAGWYRQRTQRPLMLMFPPPGQIFLAHLEWERTGINMATWRGAWEAVAQSESATNPGPQWGNQLLFLLLLLFLPSPSSSICLLYPLNSWTDKRRARLVALLGWPPLDVCIFHRSRAGADKLINRCVIPPCHHGWCRKTQ